MIKNRKIILIFLSALLLFFFRWTIIDNFVYCLVKLSFSEQRHTNIYQNQKLKYSVKWSAAVEQKNNGDDFGNGVVPFIIVRAKKADVSTTLVSYILKKEANYDKSILLNFWGKTVFGGRGISLQKVNNFWAIVISKRFIAGNDRRGYSIYFIKNSYIYEISTTSYISSYYHARSILTDFLNDFKIN